MVFFTTKLIFPRQNSFFPLQKNSFFHAKTHFFHYKTHFSTTKLIFPLQKNPKKSSTYNSKVPLFSIVNIERDIWTFIIGIGSARRRGRSCFLIFAVRCQMKLCRQVHDELRGGGAEGQDEEKKKEKEQEEREENGIKIDNDDDNVLEAVFRLCLMTTANVVKVITLCLVPLANMIPRRDCRWSPHIYLCLLFFFTICVFCLLVLKISNVQSSQS